MVTVGAAVLVNSVHALPDMRDLRRRFTVIRLLDGVDFEVVHREAGAGGFVPTTTQLRIVPRPGLKPASAYTLGSSHPDQPTLPVMEGQAEIEAPPEPPAIARPAVDLRSPPCKRYACPPGVWEMWSVSPPSLPGSSHAYAALVKSCEAVGGWLRFLALEQHRLLSRMDSIPEDAAGWLRAFQHERYGYAWYIACCTLADWQHLRGHLRRAWEHAPGSLKFGSGLVLSQDDQAHPFRDVDQAESLRPIPTGLLFLGCSPFGITADDLECVEELEDTCTPAAAAAMVRPLDGEFAAVDHANAAQATPPSPPLAAPAFSPSPPSSDLSEGSHTKNKRLEEAVDFPAKRLCVDAETQTLDLSPAHNQAPRTKLARRWSRSLSSAWLGMKKKEMKQQ